MRRRRLMLLMVLLIWTNQLLAADDFKFDHADVADYGAGTLKSLLHATWKGQASLSSFDMTKPILEGIASKDGKRFIFVGFKDNTEKGGFMTIFQVCENGELNSWTYYRMADYGLVADLGDVLKGYQMLRTDGTKSFDIPDACPTSDRD